MRKIETICQMEVHPTLIRLHRERTELFKKWREIYGPNPWANAQMQGMGQCDLVTALLGGLGAQGAAGYPPSPFEKP